MKHNAFQHILNSSCACQHYVWHVYQPWKTVSRKDVSEEQILKLNVGILPLSIQVSCTFR